MIVVGICVGSMYWFRESKRDGRVALIYLGGLAGAFLGAKLAFLFAEGWLYRADPNRWLIWLSGKSVMGALPGGWLGVEWTKKSLGYTAVTGDRFAAILPVPLILGRLGCLHAGCCGGIECSFGPWPSVPVEIGFLGLMLLVIQVMRWRAWQVGQHFHLFLIAYGLFRFFHEFLRATPKSFWGLSGYQILALATALAAGWAYFLRGRRLRRGEI